MSLIFGALTQDSVDFQIVRAKAGGPESLADLPAAAVHFRKVSTLGASYLVYIGISLCSINLH